MKSSHADVTAITGWRVDENPLLPIKPRVKDINEAQIAIGFLRVRFL